jgi:DNA-binding SARP family transcriptional activator/tetratricopeptide (TPR) repeat protein
MIQVRTLGTLEVLAGEQCITPDSTMMFALALFLSVSAGQRVPRSRLLNLFWPETSDNSRRHALRQLIYRLRRTGFPLSLDGEELLVDEAAVESDVRRVLGATWADDASDAEVAAAGNFLPAYAPPMPELYRAWLDELRSLVASQYRRALLRQIESARRDGRWHDVNECARRCLAVDPLNEEATLAHAEAIAMSGSKTQALKIIDQYLDELGDRDRVIGLPAKVLRRRVSESVPDRTRAEPEVVPLIGREREVAQMVDALSGTLSGRGAALFIVGAAGIGKTRLGQELLATAAMRGWRTLGARLQPSDAQRPLGLFVDLFAALLQLPGALGCSPDSLAQLRLLTEHQVRADGGTQRSQEAEAVQERLRIAAADLLESIVSEGPLVLSIDDLHWCDDASSHLLQFLVSRTAGIPVMWALTARPEGRYDSVRDRLSELHVDTLRVMPLTPDSANTLFDVLSTRDGARSDVSSELTSAVTGGNPLFVLELARHVRETGRAASLPKSLRGLIRDRAARLSPTAQHVLHTCAILGRFSSVPRVASVLEIGTADLLACIEELDALGIVGTGRDAESLSLHDLWREELLTTLLPASAKLLHHRCGLVLEGECRLSRSPAVVWEAAQHLVACGSEGRALSLLEECAQHQLDNGMPSDAAKSFELAFQASTTDADRMRAMNGRIAALKRAADWIQIAGLVRTAIELASRSSLHSGTHSDLELLETEVMWRTESDLPGGLRRSVACAIDGSAAIPHRAHAALLAAIVADNICAFPELTRMNDIATTIVPSTGDARTNLLSIRLIYETILGSPEVARDCGAQLVGLERESGSVRGLVRALRYSSHAYRLLGDYRDALASVEEALELAEHHHLVGDAAAAADIVAAIHLDREDLRSAERAIVRLESLAAKVGAKYALASTAYTRGIYALLVGDPTQAARCIEPYSANHLLDPIVRQRMLYLSILARVEVESGNRERLIAIVPLLREALGLRRSTAPHDFHVVSYLMSLEALGRRDAAVAYASEFVSVARRDRTRPLGTLASFLQAALHHDPAGNR